jgi:predicted 2-oxoglutarate/Fe(II)-dependent dioxygenase YbiX
MIGVTTCRQLRQLPEAVSLEPEPASGGANFVDVTLKVKVEMSVGTLIAFRPENLHGTTRLCGAHTRVATICFASRIKAAFEKAQQGLSVEPHMGAGEGGE